MNRIPDLYTYVTVLIVFNTFRQAVPDWRTREHPQTRSSWLWQLDRQPSGSRRGRQPSGPAKHKLSPRDRAQQLLLLRQILTQKRNQIMTMMRRRLSDMDEGTIKTPNPKCRLYWCLIEFIDWRHSPSYTFDPICELLPLYLLSDLPHPSPLPKVNV